jgi:hypothetical protein
VFGEFNVVGSRGYVGREEGVRAAVRGVYLDTAEVARYMRPGPRADHG